MPQGALPQRGGSPWSWSHLCPPNWKISPSQWTCHPRWVPSMLPNGGCLPGGNPHSLFPHSWSPRIQWWHTSYRCGSSPGIGQQGSRRPANGQVFHQCPLAEVGLRVQHGPSWEWFWGYGVYQGGKGGLHPFYPGGWGLLFCSCQGGRSPEGLPGYFHSAVTPQNCSVPWRGIYWRGEKGSAQLPLHLPGCLEGQAFRIPWHAVTFVLQLGGTCTNGSFLWHSLGSSTLSTRAHPRTSSPPAPDQSLRPKWWGHSPDLMDTSPLSGATSQATPEGPSTSKQWDNAPSPGADKKQSRGI